MNKPIWQYSATELAPILASGELTPQDLLNESLQRIELLNPTLNAVITINEQAQADAEDSARRLHQGKPRSPLEGIPITVKDNIPVKNLRLTWGSRAFADNIAEHDELPVERLRNAGAVIIGKTNVPEFTVEGYTHNLLFGTTRNPWNTELTPGGSSGGAVASVAAGITAVAIGTDGGGSIRRPACHTGLVGFKPSTGRIARINTLPQILLDFEVAGPLTRTVADAELLFQIMAGPDPRDRRSLLQVEQKPLDKPLRILYVPRFGTAPVDVEIDASVAAAAKVLEGLGHRVEQGELPFSVDALNAAWPQFGQTGVAYLFQRYPAAKALAGPNAQKMAEQGAALTAAGYLGLIETVEEFRREVMQAFSGFDVMLTPAAAALPWPAAEPYPEMIAGEAVGPRGHAVYSGWVNACGHPAISLPCAPSVSGLPVGLQLVAGFGQDKLLLALAKQFEDAAPWSERWPELALNTGSA